MALAAVTSVRPADVNALLEARGTSPLAHAVPAVELAKRSQITLADVFGACAVGGHLSREGLVSADLEIKYAGYFARERVAADRLRDMGDVALAPDLPYATFRSLSLESRQKLATIQPTSLAQAARVPGVSPSDVQNLVIEIERIRHRRIAVPASDVA